MGIVLLPESNQSIVGRLSGIESFEWNLMKLHARILVALKLWSSDKSACIPSVPEQDKCPPSWGTHVESTPKIEIYLQP
jgi:hypothetical protein